MLDRTRRAVTHWLGLASIVFVLLLPRTAEARVSLEADAPVVEIVISKAMQTMAVYVDGALLEEFIVSTGSRRQPTPSGRFRPTRMHLMAYAPKYDYAPMPHAIFFTRDGHAIHATGHLAELGRPASHGCVRLTPEAAAWLYALVKQHGMQRTIIHVF
jgi:lipoprotein-anchoring transpeptidase ErfK/SrfK